MTTCVERIAERPATSAIMIRKAQVVWSVAIAGSSAISAQIRLDTKLPRKASDMMVMAWLLIVAVAIMVMMGLVGAVQIYLELMLD